MSTQSTQPIPQLLLTPEEEARIVADLKAAGLLDPSGKAVVNTLNLPNPPVGLFAQVYADIYSFIKDSTAVDANTKFWFSAAAAINGNDSIGSAQENKADRFIRGTTQYGLAVRGRLAGLSQSQIEAGIQRTSNLIGQNVISQILQVGGIPVFGSMLTNDIAAAILTELPVRRFEQDAGGWGGSFYFWNESLNYGKSPNVTVGTAILSGLPASASPTKQGQPPSLTEFLYANASASVDAGIQSVSASNNAPISSLRSLLNSFSSTLSQIKTAGQQILTTVWNAETPAYIKYQIGVIDTPLIALERRRTGNLLAGPNLPNVSRQSISGDSVTTVYKDGGRVVQDLDVGIEHWTNADGSTGTMTVEPDGEISLAQTLAGGGVEVAAINPDDRVDYVAGSGAMIGAPGSDRDTLEGGTGNNTYAVQTLAAGVARHDRRPGWRGLAVRRIEPHCGCGCQARDSTRDLDGRERGPVPIRTLGQG